MNGALVRSLTLALIPFFVGSWCLGQDSSMSNSRRKNVATTKINFPGSQESRSLLAKMTEENQRQSKRDIGREKETQKRPNNDFLDGRRSRSARPAVRKQDLQYQYPVFKQKVNSRPHPVTHQRPVRVVSPRRIGLQPENSNEVSNPQDKFVGSENTNASLSLAAGALRGRSSNVATPAEAALLVSVLESNPFPDQESYQIVEVPTPVAVRSDTRLNKNSPMAKTLDSRKRRPKDVLLGRKPDQASLKLSPPTDPNASEVNENVFKSRVPLPPFSSNTDRTAKHELITTHFSDQKISVDVGAQSRERLRFNKPAQDQSVGANDQQPKLDNVESVESEKFTGRSKEARSVVEVSKILMHGQQRYVPNRPAQNSTVIQMSFGDQEQPRLEEQDLVFESDVDVSSDPESVNTVPLEPVNEEQDEVQQNQRASYLSDLRRGLSIAPAQLALNYVDDDGTQVPTSAMQRRHLVEFGGFYTNSLSSDPIRTNPDATVWGPNCGVWVTPNICYPALYFEDENLERFGARRPFLQPGWSAVHFFGSAIRLPYMVGLDPFQKCKYRTGYQRPGSSGCYQRGRFVWHPQAGTFQALLITAGIFALP